MLSHCSSDSSCISNPFFLFPIPVIIPEKLIGAEHWHLIKSKCSDSARHNQMQVGSKIYAVSRRNRNSCQRPYLWVERLDSQQGSESTSFKLNQTLSVCCRAFWKNIDWRDYTRLSVFCSFSKFHYDFFAVFFWVFLVTTNQNEI